VLRALDDQHVRRDLPGLKFQVELFFDGGKNDAGEVRGLGHGCWCVATGPASTGLNSWLKL